MTDLRYPIGPFEIDPVVTEQKVGSWIEEIAAAPARLRAAAASLDEEQLETPYRPGGWKIRQVVHHLPDSHINAYVRFRLALTEDVPTIKTYAESDWAELEDARRADIAPSLELLDSLHARWTYLLRSLSPDALARRLLHPELGELTLATLVQLYAWHGRHHVAHITSLRDREGWKTI